MTGNWKWKHVNQYKRKAARFYKQHGFWPTEEACGTCQESRQRHHPDDINHDFISTKKKALRGLN